MPVPPVTQMTMAQTYARLANAVTHDPTSEKGFLAPHFTDRAKIKLAAFEYDPLTVQVLAITPRGKVFLVHARYVGVGTKNDETVDRWLLLDGAWRLAERNEARP